VDIRKSREKEIIVNVSEKRLCPLGRGVQDSEDMPGKNRGENEEEGGGEKGQTMSWEGRVESNSESWRKRERKYSVFTPFDKEGGEKPELGAEKSPSKRRNGFKEPGRSGTLPSSGPRRDRGEGTQKISLPSIIAHQLQRQGGRGAWRTLETQKEQARSMCRGK